MSPAEVVLFDRFNRLQQKLGPAKILSIYAPSSDTDAFGLSARVKCIALELRCGLRMELFADRVEVYAESGFDESYGEWINKVLDPRYTRNDKGEMVIGEVQDGV